MNMGLRSEDVSGDVSFFRFDWRASAVQLRASRFPEKRAGEELSTCSLAPYLNSVPWHPVRHVLSPWIWQASSCSCLDFEKHGATSVSVWSVLKIHGKKDNRLNLIDTKHDNTLSKS